MKSITLAAVYNGAPCFINCGGHDLDWLFNAPPDSPVCVVLIDEGGYHQTLVRKSELSEIRVSDDD